MEKALLISIKPIYADAIYRGLKSIELRRHLPVNFDGTTAFIYETSPISMVTGLFVVGGFITLPKTQFWERFRNESYISKTVFESYFDSCTVARGIYILDSMKFQTPMSVSAFLRNRPPQSWCYVQDRKEFYYKLH